MIYMCLPQQMGVTLELCSDTVTNFHSLEDLTVLWRDNRINQTTSPTLTLLAQFKSMIDSMPKLRFLHAPITIA